MRIYGVMAIAVLLVACGVIHPYGDKTKAFQEWAGLDFDPERFDRQAVNATISRMLWNRWIKIGP